METPKIIKLNKETKSIGILSDSHGYLDDRIKTVLKDCDILIHAGDIMDKSVIDSLERINPKLYCVTGNNDIETVWPKKDKNIIRNMPESLIFEVGKDKIGLIHGHQFGWNKPDYTKMRDFFSDCRLIIYGHTHQQIINTHISPWIINPGASGKTRIKGGPSCLILNIDKNNWRIETIKYLDLKMVA